MEREFTRSSNTLGMFGGVQPSKQAADLARRAIGLGEDPTALTQQAGEAARRQGKGKVGFFGEAARPLTALKEAVLGIEGQKAMLESSRRANRR